MKQYPHHIDILKSVLSLKAFFFKKNIYLAALGLGFGMPMFSCSMWDLLASPALQGRFLTTEPPGRPLLFNYKDKLVIIY